MEELHVDVLEGSSYSDGKKYIEKMFEQWKRAHPRAHIKQLHYSTCYVDPGTGVANSVLIEYTEES